MSKHFTPHAVAFSLAVLMTVGVLGSLNNISSARYQAAQQDVAQQALCVAKA